MSTEKAAIEKLRSMTQGHIEIMSDADLDLLCKIDLSNAIRSRPNPNQVGTLDRWECWIERRDIVRLTSAE